MPFVLFLLVLVGLSPSALSLECKSCESTLGWDDCQANVFLEDCATISPNETDQVHQCFQLEEIDPATNTVRYRQGCTGDAAFCTARLPGSIKQCSLCTDDSNSSECTSLVHRVRKTSDGKLVDVVDTIHFQRTEADVEPATSGGRAAANSSTTIDIASRKNDTNESFLVKMKNEESSDQDKTRIKLTKLADSPIINITTAEPTKSTTARNRPCHRDFDHPSRSGGSRSTEAAEASTTVGPYGPIVATGPPPPKTSGSFRLNEGGQIWVTGLLMAVSCFNLAR
ncbi:uncharacterized protein LOC115256366 [Aedes albopictus]|uniref:Secreted protein n=1 Tax=Aedes albopictus TaxID=7160 RepID=A0ABM1ZH43_AEDAL|nr:uncharacterized protein LOC115256366 [Aedes albopictus]